MNKQENRATSKSAEFEKALQTAATATIILISFALLLRIGKMMLRDLKEMGL